MNSNSLKQTVISAVEVQKFDDLENIKVDKIITCCLLYKRIMTLSKNDASYDNTYKETARKFAASCKSTLDSLKEKYASYNALKNRIKNYNVESFMEMNTYMINDLYEVYSNRQTIIPFSSIKFSVSMYCINNISYTNLERLKTLHFKLFVPIATYYKQHNHIIDSNITIENENENNPGKCVKIAIKGIDAAQIYRDLKDDVFKVSEYVQNFNLTSDGFVKIITK